MLCYSVNPCQTTAWVRVILVACMVLLVSGWTTCNAIFAFSGCESSIPQPQLASMSPEPMPGDEDSIVLTVSGTGFAPQSQIMWNGTPLPTTFLDSSHLQTTITQQTFSSFGGSAGSTVRIWVNSPSPRDVLGCPNGGSSLVLLLNID